MIGLRFVIYLLIALLFIAHASAANVHGTVYDISLVRLSNVKVEINTTPKQVVIAQDGDYSFDVLRGAYTIKAELLHKNTVIASAQENLTIKEDGSYVIDLILFPEIEEGIEEIEIDLNESITDAAGKYRAGLFISATLLILAILICLFYILKYKQLREKIDENTHVVHQDKDLIKILEIIKQEGGRVTQKEIRKQIPLSDAKISLMITELEHKGTIKKIKRGRGNVIILTNGQ